MPSPSNESMFETRVDEQREAAGSAAVSLRAQGWPVPSLSDFAFLIPILVLFWCTTGVGWLLADSDTGWHIRTGEWILTNGHVPATDIFSFTKTGMPWFAWEWLSDVFMAGIHYVAGLGGLVLASLVLLGLTSVWVYKNAVAESGHRLIAMVLTSLAMAASTIHWLARPHLVTPLMTAAFLWVLGRVHRDGALQPLLVLPPLTILWVNLHGGFFVGIVLLITFALGTLGEELIRSGMHRGSSRARKYLVTAGACAVASLVNPYGYRLHIHVLQYLTTSFYVQRISEFQSIDFHSFNAAYFETLLVLSIAAAFWHLGSGRLVHVMLLLSWSHLALFSVRNIPIFAVIAVPGVALALREWLAHVRLQCSLRWLWKLRSNLAELEAGLQVIASSHKRDRWHLVPCLTLLVLAVLFIHPGRVKALRAEFDRNRFPADAATFLSGQQTDHSIRLYSSWQWGGYLIYRLWPSLRVFDDGRTDFYGPAFVEEGLQVWDACPDWASILARYRVNAALLPVDSAVATVLHERRDWELVYKDLVAVLFEKTDNGK